MSCDSPLISIIVPIYNAELYLADCLSSIASQTYGNIEAILINDGSKDNSCNIAESFCKKDSRFQLINQVNSGVAAAREKGLRLAQGEFVIHADSDDLMTKRAIEYLYSSIVKNNSDIAIGSYIIKRELSEEIVRHKLLSTDEFICNIFTGKYHASLWNKLIRTELCENISFDKNINYMEDKLFLLKVLNKENVKVSITHNVVYYYRMVDTSYTNYMTEDSLISSNKVTRKICDMFSNRYNDVFLSHIKNKNKINILLNSNLSQRDVFPESIRFLLHDNNLLLKHKVVILLDQYYMRLPIKVYNLVGISAKKFKANLRPKLSVTRKTYWK